MTQQKRFFFGFLGPKLWYFSFYGTMNWNHNQNRSALKCAMCRFFVSEKFNSFELQIMLNSFESNYLRKDMTRKVFVTKCLEVAIFLIPSILMNEALWHHRLADRIACATDKKRLLEISLCRQKNAYTSK